MDKKFLLEKYKNISRVDQESKLTHGWYARVNHQGRTISKFFSDKKHGGRASSLLLALDWRDSTTTTLDKLLPDGALADRQKTSTGVVGVRLNERCNRYEVSWRKNGTQGGTSVSILKHGKKMAFEIACRIRQEKTK
jgi:hypothetical protein